ncbi:MAG: RpiB/LacA/LacB family sugar-phosphate isomerase [Candidatus Saccharibacteria bacterium]
MKIFVGADHKGYGLKQELASYLKKAGYDVEDAGDDHYNPDDDFPVFAAKAVQKVLASDDPEPRAVLICGSGQGMVMAANRFKGIRAGLGWSIEAAKATRNDEDSNVLALPAVLFGEEKRHNAFVITEVWLNTPFANAPRFIRRNQELDNL